MKNSFIAIFSALVFGLSIMVFAQSETDTKATEENILNGLREARPDLSFGNPVPAPISGYYEVTIAGTQTVYVSEDGKHFFSGELYFAEPGRFVNATELARTDMRKEVLASIDDSEKIIFSPEGETKGVLTIFTDVTCGYCRKLHSEIHQINALGIEVQYLAYPRSGIERNGVWTNEYQQTAKAWCADDREATMTALKNGQSVDQETCDSETVAKHFEIGGSFGVTGTPAIVLPDGSLLPGYRSAEQYAQLLGIDTDS